MQRVAIIMAGGSGERFWPLSRKKFPKQLLSLGLTDKSMIEEAIDRIENLIPIEDIYIITSEILAEPIRLALENFPDENVIPEPAKRNTAPCLALSAAFLLEKYKLTAREISVAVLTADHIMEPLDKFIETIDSALKFVESTDAIATIGITPSRPETGYGYIELNKLETNGYKTEIFAVNKFKEKPDLKTANEYIQSGNYLWNSGMFFYNLNYFNTQLEKYLPEVGCKINELSRAYSGHTTGIITYRINNLVKLFESMPSISIDFGLMEKADSVVCVKALFEWDDIGDLNSLQRTKKADENRNIKHGIISSINSKDNILINNSTKKLVLSGVNINNLVVVVTDDAVLVCNRDNVQDVKLAVNDIRENISKEYL